MSASRPTLNLTLEQLASDPRLVWRHHEPAVEPRRASPPHQYEEICRHLAPEGLWTHQALALDKVAGGHNVVVATSTSSGKSMCYQVPIRAALNADPKATALVIQPTKALAHDQLASMRSLAGSGLCVGYDADTDQDARLVARRSANVLFTNPEMVHGSLLAGHMRWARFWSNLAFVVVDELHTYRGVFGSHVAQVLRRLRRVAALHGSKPQFIFTSATVDNAGDFAQQLLGESVRVVDDDGSPHGQRTTLAWDPAVTNSNSMEESARLATHFAGSGHRTIVFARSRHGAEELTNLIRTISPSLAVETYRAGYTADERRQVETALVEGSLSVVVSTPALELGIDIGDLDVAIAAGFPGSLTSLRQQSGRVGRRGQHSASIFVAANNPLDRWFVNHPDQTISRPCEAAITNPEAMPVVRRHVACAAHEIPLDPMTDSVYWPTALDAAVCDLASVGLVSATGGRASFVGRSSPAREIGLRGGEGGSIRIEDRNGVLVGTTDIGRARFEVYPGARYRHRGSVWRVVQLDLAQRLAVVEPDDRGQLATSPITSLDLVVMDQHVPRSGPVPGGFGTIEVTTTTTGYRTRSPGKSERHDLAIEPSAYTTDGFWLEFAKSKRLSLSAIHAAEHALIAASGLFAICDPGDVAGRTENRGGSTLLFILDGHAGGNGVSALLFSRLDAVAAQAIELVSGCGCTNGCPSCVVSSRCERGNRYLAKVGAISVLERIAG